jgi:two-component system sensor histidine kinase KdpD
MLRGAIRCAGRGEDVAIGVVESHGRKAIAELASRIDRIPPRKPSVVLVDELAHSNIECSRHTKRFEDLMDLLEAGIDVLSTMNVQHIESLGPTVLQITRVQVRETVPDW